jgi:glyoxylase-like metal-dependent hydrolase (beta-lactamase superfamily II)
MPVIKAFDLAAFNIGDMLEAYHALRAHAPSPDHIIPGHDPIVMRQYPALRPELEGVVVRLDVTPKIKC